MNIRDAKEQVCNTVKAYLARDEYGNLMIPTEKQRPIFLMGPPGIGKTAIMEQVAAEMGVALVSYSMTHHTRQSALGLPFIEHKNYNGMECNVSEYTMSEIIAAVYDRMQETGLNSGILFLDEINCVSETLAPVMLQFLQYKVFGRHQVPEGWVVVTAGNPPEYNTSVREFDVVTWDRLKRIDVEPDYAAWREYALNRHMHPSVLTYLEARKGEFYKIESTVDGKRFVTARGWEDLSQMLWIYEKYDMKVNEALIAQYLQDPKSSCGFAVYYDLFRKYQEDYKVEAILSGTAGEKIDVRAHDAGFDERLALLGLLLDAIGGKLRAAVMVQDEAGMLAEELKKLKKVKGNGNGGMPPVRIAARIRDLEQELARDKKTGGKTVESQQLKYRVAEDLRTIAAEAGDKADQAKMDAAGDRLLNDRLDEMNQRAADTGFQLSNLFRFCERNFDEKQEMLILVTELTINRNAVRFISRWGCDEYFAHNSGLKFYERQRDIDQRLQALDETIGA